MKTINALTIRNHLGEVLNLLDKTGEPVLVSKGKEIRAVLITPEQFQRRFLDYQADEKKQELLSVIRKMKEKRLGKKSSAEVLRESEGVFLMIWVIDASVAVKWFLQDEANPQSEAILERLISEPELFAIPELFCFEVFSVLSRVHPYGGKVFFECVLPLLEGGLLRQPMTAKLAANAEQFVKMGLTGYDACYAALAKEIKGAWLTFDEKAHRLITKQNISCYLETGLPKNWQ